MFLNEDRAREQFQAQLDICEENYNKNKNDSYNLIKWGQLLIEMAHLKQPSQAEELMDQAIFNFEMAKEVVESGKDQSPATEQDEVIKGNPNFYLGFAHVQKAFLMQDRTDATSCFDKAKDFYQKAIDQEGENPMYMQGLKMLEKAPEIWQKIRNEMNLASSVQESAVTSKAGKAGPKLPKKQGAKSKKPAKGKSSFIYDISDFWWDVMGWITLGGVMAGISFLSMPTEQVQPQRPSQPPMPMK